MKPEVVFTSSAPRTGFSEGTESPIAQGVKCGGFLFVSEGLAYIPSGKPPTWARFEPIQGPWWKFYK